MGDADDARYNPWLRSNRQAAASAPSGVVWRRSSRPTSTEPSITVQPQSPRKSIISPAAPLHSSTLHRAMESRLRTQWSIPAARTPSTELRRNPSQRESPPEHQRQAPLCYKSRVQRREPVVTLSVILAYNC